MSVMAAFEAAGHRPRLHTIIRCLRYINAPQHPPATHLEVEYCIAGRLVQQRKPDQASLRIKRGWVMSHHPSTTDAGRQCPEVP